MSDDEAVVHVAAAALHKRLEAWLPHIPPTIDEFVTTTAKLVLDAVDQYEAGGGGTVPPEEPATEPAPEPVSVKKSKS